MLTIAMRREMYGNYYVLNATLELGVSMKMPTPLRKLLRMLRSGNNGQKYLRLEMENVLIILNGLPLQSNRDPETESKI